MAGSKMRRLVVSVAVFVMIMSLWGCAAYRGPAALAERPRELTKEDVVNMATSDIGDEVIIAQIEATGSRFELSVADITELKKAGVSEKVIEHMISTGKESEVRYWRDYYHPYPHPYWLHPYYPSVRVVYYGGAWWHHRPRRGGPGFWVRARR